ncbi:polysaccharide export protein EpsE [Methylobacillus methanolivorans]|uniref:Polysaccharide export protein EpsE n=1 Tax=Methylobacillus methanolivorans TaxID=1848927 RepID=A0ABW8GHL7_9PROT
MNKIIKWLLLVLFLMSMSNVHAAETDISLGPGDILRISVFEQPDLSLEVRVSDSGTITYPLIGEIMVGGETTANVERKIAAKLEQGGFLKNPHVSIIVTQMQSKQISVLGQVNRPGRYPLDTARSLADILALAGGISPEGGDVITLIQNTDGVVSKKDIDLAEMMRSGNMQENIVLSAGDIIFVDRVLKFYIYGEVQRPSQYRLEHNMTVLQALSVGGGLTARGTERGIKIKRKVGDVMEVLKVKHDDIVLPNDIIYVEESLF